MATYTVTTAQDEVFDADETVGSPDGTGLSLREAIGLAAASPGADRIVFDTSLLGSTLTLAGGVLTLADAAGVTIDGDIDGDGIGDVTISGNSSSGVFSVASGTARLDTLTITGGSATAGGGIVVASGANLTLTASEVTGNTTPVLGTGGGIYVLGTLVAVGSTIANNSSFFGGGVSVAASGDATFVNTTFHNNTGGQYGGAISNLGTLALISSTVTGNSTSGSGGGLFDSSSQVTITNTILAGNNAASGSGAEDISGTIDTASGVNIFGQSTVLGAGTNDILNATVTDVFASTATINGVVAGVLADNGGPVDTVLIQRGGTADAAGDASALPTDTADIDGDTDTSELLPLDARGAPRVSGSGLDVGAVEAGEAPSLIVTTLADVVDDRDGQTSLREAIAFANSQAGADTITFASGLSGGTALLTNGQLTLNDTDGVTISGNVTVDAQRTSRVFEVSGGVATLDGLTITNGLDSTGGGVRVTNSATLNLSNAVLISNTATNSGGGIIAESGSTLNVSHSTFSQNTAIEGGGISTSGATNVISTTFERNTATYYGGGVDVGGGSATFTNTTFHNNSAINYYGGAIYAGGVGVTVNSSTITGNFSGSSGGGIYARSSLNISNSIVVGNVSGSYADIYTDSTAVSYIGGNIVGTNIFNGSTDVGDTSAAQVFAATVTNNGVLAGALGDNGGPVQTVALLGGGDAVGRGDATLLPADTFDLDNDSNTAEPLPVDATGRPRIDGTLDLGAVEAGEIPSLIVTTLTDVVDDRDGQTSLREAIAFANSQAGADTITFASGLSGTLRLTQGELVITDAVTIDGGGLITITGDAADNDVTDANDITDVAASGATLLADNSRVFRITSADAATTLSGLTITGGRTTADSEEGGGVRSVADLTLVGSTVAGNSTAGSSSYGGGISGDRLVTLTNSTVSGNSTAGTEAQGGGMFGAGVVTLTNSTVSGNSTVGTDAEGGGIYSYRGVALTNSTISGNSTAGVFAEGGGIYSYGAVTLTNSTISGNSTAGTDAEGGGIYGQEAVTLTNSTVSGNGTAGVSADGGGIYTTGYNGGNGITLSNSIVLGNTTTGSGVGGDELLVSTSFGASVTSTGGNIVGTNIFNGSTDVGDTTAAQVFAATVNNNGVLAGALGDNGGPVQTIALLTSGDAVGRGDATLLPADTFDLDNDSDTAETLPVDATGRPRIGGTLDLGAVEAREDPSLIVTTVADVVDGADGQTSLREAIAFANSQAGADTITFAASLAGGAILLTNGQLTLNDSDGVTISGNVTVDAQRNSRVFEVSGGVATLDGLTITNGLVSTEDGGGASVTNGATLNVSNAVFTSNSSPNLGGGGIDVDSGSTLNISHSTFSQNTAIEGGGIKTNGITSVISTTFERNTALYYGGGVATGGGSAAFTNTTLHNNSALSYYGGAIFQRTGDVTIGSSTITGNSAGIYGGGIFSWGPLNLSNSIVVGNTAGSSGGDIRSPVTYTGGNIVGTNIFNGSTDVGDSTAAQVFAATVTNNGVLAGALGDNGGSVQTVALLAGGDAIGRGDPTLLPADTFDLDNDSDTVETLPVDAIGGPRVVGTLDLGAVEASEDPSLIITTLTDVADDRDGQTSLREAIAFANSQAGADTITFAAGLSGTLRLTQGELVITDAVTIDGGGLITITGDAADNDATDANDITDVAASGADLLDDNSRVFNITATSAATTLGGLTITGGRTTADNINGGGIFSFADVTLVGSTIAGNSTAGSSAGGGGVFGTRSVTLANSTLSGNSTAGVDADGGGVFSSIVRLTNSTVSGNSTSGETAEGAGIYSRVTTELTNSTVSGNSTAGTGAEGGGIFSAGLSGGGIGLTNSIVLGNTTTGSGVGGDEISVRIGSNTPFTGGNIVGTNIFNGSTDVGNTTAAQVFAATVNNNGVLAGALGDNGGSVQTIALLAGGDAVGRGDATLLPADTFDLDNDSDTVETLPVDATGRPRIDGTLDLGAVEAREDPSLIVTTVADVVDGADGQTSLREAIAFANSQAGPDRIVFDVALLGSTLTLTGGVLTLADAAGVTIDGDINGDGIGDVTISGNSSSGVFSVASGTARLDALTITGGSAAAGAGIVVASGANLTLTASEVTGNSTTGPGTGGGIRVQGTLNAVGSTIANNSSFIGGGVSVTASGDATFVNTTFHNNTSGQNGGALSNAGTLALISSTVTGNSTSGSGGGLFDSSSQVTITNTILAGNNAASGSGTEDISGTIDTASGVNIFGQSTVLGAGTNDIVNATVTDVFASTATINGVVAGVLADNGGPVDTVLIQRGGTTDAAGDASALPTDSADIDGDTDTSELLPLDARGAPRVSGSGLDVGAVEAGEAPSLIVTTLADVVDDRDGQTSLREAIAFANSQAGADAITFAAGLFGTLRLTQGELVITDAVTIDGGGLITITGDAADNDATDANDITDVANSGPALLGDNSRVFNITSADAATTLSGLTITGGRTTADIQGGGGVRSLADLMLVNSTVSGNSTAGFASSGGGVSSQSVSLPSGVLFIPAVSLTNSVVSGNGTSGSNSAGGGIHGYDVTLTNSSVDGNSTGGARAAGGGIAVGGFGALTATNSTVSGNSTTGSGSDGGGIFSNAVVTLTNSTVSGNSTAGSSGEGGGIFSGGLSGSGITLTNSIVLGNTTTGSGVDGDELFVRTNYGASVTYTGGNIVGTNIFSGSTDVGDTTATQVFATTVDNNGVLAGALGNNGGSVQTIALLAGGDAVGRGDATLLPADTFDLDNDGDTAEALPVDATGGPRVFDTLDLGAVEAGEDPSLIVTTLTDVVDDRDGQTSLREAIAFANSQAATDAITFASGLSGTLRLTQGEIVITDAVTIDGGGLITITGDAADNDVTDANDITDVAASGATLLTDNSRVFNITASSAVTTLSGLTITGGRTTGLGEDGGGIRSTAELTLVNTMVSGNSTAGDRSMGGGIYGYRMVTLANTTVSGNRTMGSFSDGGGVSGAVVTLANSTVSINSTAGSNAVGGGIYSYDSVTLTNSTVSGNSTGGAGSTGGGIYSAGAIGNGLALTNSIVLGNITTGPGVGDDELYSNTNYGGSTTYTGGNIVGTNIFSGSTDVGDTTAAQVFAATVNNNGVDAGALGNNGGSVQTIAILAGGDADGLGDATLLPADTFDLDNDSDTAEALPLDATGGPRVVGALDLGALEAAAQLPVFEGALADLTETVDLAENSSAATLVFDVDANDGKGGGTDAGVTFEITAGNVSQDGDADLPFAIDSLTGAITVNDPGDLDFETTLSFTLTVEANNAEAMASATLTVSLTDVDEVAPLIADQSFSYEENQSANAVLATVGATDNVAVTSFEITSGDPNTFFAIDSAGQITLTAAGLTAAASDFETGPNTFPLTVTARDAAGNTSSPATVTLTVSDAIGAIALAPTDTTAGEPADNGQVTVTLDDPLSTDTVISYTVAGTATPGADYLALSGSVTILLGNTSAPIDVNVIDDALVESDETVIITLTETDSANAAIGPQAAATVTITSDDVESTLDAVDDIFTIDEDMTLQGNVIANDTSADPSAIRSVLINGEILPQGQALTEITLANGTLAINRLGDFVYTPNTDFFGVETFNYTSRDGSIQSDDATVTITVSPVQDAPVAVDDLFSSTQNTPVSGNVLLNDSDADGDALRSIIVEGVVLAPGLALTEVALEDGTLQINRLGEFIYTPDDDFTGEEEFNYEVRDGNGGSDEATVTVSVDPVPLVESRALKLDFRNNRKILNEKVDEDGRDNGLSFVDVDPGAEVLGEGILDNRGGNGLSLFKFDSLGPISHTEAVRVHKPEGIGIGRDRVIDDDDILNILFTEDEANGGKLQFGNPNGFNRDGDLDPGERIEVELFLDSEEVLRTFFTHDPNASGSLRSLALDELDGFDGTMIFDEIHVSTASEDTEFTLRDITIFTVVPDPDFV